MRTADQLRHALTHQGLTGVLGSQHHMEPAAIAVANTTQQIYPLPGGPGQWDIAVPSDATVVLFSLQSPHLVANGGAKAGVTGLATLSSLEAAAASLGGWSTTAMTAYNAIYTKAAGALNLSHKVFTVSGRYIALTEAYLTNTGPSTRVLRTVWTNYGASIYTLSARGTVQVMG